MATNKITEAKKLTEKGLYNEAYDLLKCNITKAAHMAQDYRDLWNMFEEMAGAVEKSIKIHTNQMEYVGFYDNNLEAVGVAEVKDLNKSLITLRRQASAYETLYYMCNELLGIYNEAIGE